MHLLIVSHACSLPQNQQLFAIAAAKRGWRVTLVLPERWKNEYGRYHDAQLWEGFDAELVTAPMVNNGSVPLHFYRLRAAKLLRQLRPDVVYSHNEAYSLSTMQWCYANASAGKKPFGFFSCQNLRKRYPIPFRQGEAWVYRNSRFFFPITDTVDLVHRQKGYKGISTVIPLGFDPNKYPRVDDTSGRIHDDLFHLAFVGRVVEEKGLKTLARALGNIRDLRWRLTIVGSGPQEVEVRRELEKANVSDRVDWRGFVPHDKMHDFYRTIDTLVLPSESRPNWTEQFGRVLIEAMACGTPVVGSDCGEIPTIINLSQGGLVFKESDVEACGLAIRFMVANPEKRIQMGELGRDYVFKNYSIFSIAERFGLAIEEVLR